MCVFARAVDALSAAVGSAVLCSPGAAPHVDEPVFADSPTWNVCGRWSAVSTLSPSSVCPVSFSGCAFVSRQHIDG